MNSEPKHIVRNEPGGVCRFEDKRLRKPVRWVLISLRVQIETDKSGVHPFIDKEEDMSIKGEEKLVTLS